MEVLMASSNEDILLNRARSWSYGRQRLNRSSSGPLAALREVIAVHSTHPSAPLSLLCRTSGFDYAEFDRLYREKAVVSIPLMRGSFHAVSVEDASWVFSATRPSASEFASRVASRLPGIGLFETYRERLLPKLSDPVEGSKIRHSLDLSEEEFLAIRLMTRSGDVLRIATNPRSDRLLYVATSSWLGRPFDDIPRSEALERLAEAYFKAFGPARIKDFAWWVGIPQRDAKQAISQLGLVPISPDLFIAEQDENSYEATEPLAPDAISILPKWDSYTMGYAPDGRRRFVNDDHLRFAYTTKESRVGATTGDGLPLILCGGRAVASWSHQFKGAKMSIDLAPLPGERVDQRLVESRFAETAELMGCRSTTLTIAG
jgi:hypothetical protein